MMKKIQMDRGAIPHCLRGVPMMAVGFTSPGGGIPQPIEEGDPVAMMAEGKEHAAAVGVAAMSSADMKAGTKRGCGVENCHQIGDALWNNYKVTL